MPLEPGSRLGPYEILAPLGAGGMGEVYRARDSVLKRDVAIKVLPAYWSRDPERLRRFELEAQSAAALNHPNIISIFHVGEHDGAPYFVTELLQGETLRTRLRRGPLRLREVLDVGADIAQGLAAAHAAGVTHRDLKPDNLFLTKDGRVKILDFGLAKLALTGDAIIEGNTVTYREESSPGHVMGTVGYMSPEQVRGQSADPRSDIFSLGVILYEMLTGQRAFKKATPADTMAAILNEEPAPVSQTSSTMMPGLQRVIHRCLAKNPDQRFQHASDLAFALEALSDSSSSAVMPAAPDSSASRGNSVWLVAAAVLVVLAAAFLFWGTRPPAAPVVEAITQLTEDENGKGNLQTDGTRIYFNQGLEMAQVAVKGGPVAIIPSTVPTAAIGGIAPDGSSLLVLQGSIPVPRPVWNVPLPAGEARRLGTLEAHEASVTPDDRLLLSHVADLFITQKDGSNPRKLISLSEGHFGDATMSPDGRRIVFTRYGSPELYVANSDGTGVRLLAKNQEPGGFCCAKWTADGEYIVFATRFPVVRQDLWYLRMNHRWLQPANQPQRLTAGPLSYSNPTPSRDGKTIFAIGTRWRGELFRYDLTSKTLAPYFPGLFAYDPTFSRDGKWVAYLSYTDHCLWRSRSDGTERLQLTFSPLQVWDASISPDGKWVAYQSAEGPGIISADGGVPTKPSASFFVGVNWSPDGNFLVFNEGTSSWQTPEVKLLDVRTGQVRLVPGGQMHPVWAAPDKIIAARRDLMILQIYNLSTQRWSDLTKPEDGPVVNWARSPDFKYFYYTAARDPKIIRIRMADLKSEVVGSLKDFPLARGASDPTQISIAPDYSPIFTRQISAQEIYALTVKFP